MWWAYLCLRYACGGLICACATRIVGLFVPALRVWWACLWAVCLPHPHAAHSSCLPLIMLRTEYAALNSYIPALTLPLPPPCLHRRSLSEPAMLLSDNNPFNTGSGGGGAWRQRGLRKRGGGAGGQQGGGVPWEQQGVRKRGGGVRGVCVTEGDGSWPWGGVVRRWPTRRSKSGC